MEQSVGAVSSNDGVVVLNHDVGLSRFDVVAGKLFLAARTLPPRWEKPQNHLDNEHNPHRRQDDGTAFYDLFDIVTTTRAIEDVLHKHGDENH